MINKLLTLLIIVLMTTTVIAQSESEIKKQAELKEAIWGTNDSYAAVKNVPDKWKDESAVYLIKSIEYLYDRPGNSIEYTQIQRNRVKLLDQAAVKVFSEFQYDNENTFLLGIKVVKSDGKEIEVDVSNEAVSTDGEKKIAVPSLEKGDILDYYIFKNIVISENDLYQYELVENIIGSDYPIANYEFSLETEEDFFVSFNTYNGAPELKQTVFPTEKDTKRVYEFKMQDVERNNFPRWYYPIVELPAYKFQILFARSGKYEKKAYAFISEESDKIKEGVTEEEVFSLYEHKFRPFGNLGGVERFLKDRNFKTDEAKVKAVFYYIRHAYFTNYVEAIVVDEMDILFNPYSLYKERPIVFNKDEAFYKFFAAFLKDNKIDYEIIIGTKRYNGDIKDLLVEDNVDFILKINTENPIYIDEFGPYATINQIAPELENTNAYSLKVADRKRITHVETVKLPKSTYKDNVSTEKLELTISPDFTKINVTRNSAYIGQNKIREQEAHLRYYSYVYEDYRKYKTTPLLDRVKNKNRKAEYKKKYKSLVNKLKNKQQEGSKNRASAEFGTELDNYSIEISNNGRFGRTNAMEFKEDFTIIGGMISNAGKNYILEIGKFLTGQIDLGENEKQRVSNIYMSNPRSFNYEISLDIPNGYTVSGIDNLSKTVENSAGGFTSSAIQEGNKLVVKVTKHYKNYFEPNSNWPQMVAFLDAAFEFTQAKVLLKKQS